MTEDTSITVPMMYQRSEFCYGESDSLQIVELPYRDDHVQMLVLLPRAREGLPQLEHELNSERLAEWCALLSPAGTYDVRLFLPRFSMESELDLPALLPAMGIRDLFDPERADLSGMTNDKGLFMGPFLHTAGVRVDEEGTEAWAATAAFIEMGAPAPPPPVRVFRADHPFIFMITARETGTILFMGRLTEPQSMQEP